MTPKTIVAIQLKAISRNLICVILSRSANSAFVEHNLPLEPRSEGDQGFFSISSRPTTPTNRPTTLTLANNQNPLAKTAGGQMDSAAPIVETVGAVPSLLSVTRLILSLCLDGCYGSGSSLQSLAFGTGWASAAGSEMEKRADAADTSVLFFSLSCANFPADTCKLAKTLCYLHCAITWKHCAMRTVLFSNSTVLNVL